MTSNSTARPITGRPPLARGFVVRHQRRRIIAALAAEISERDYRTVTVADIVRRAGVSRNTFYANFAGKEGCFQEAQKFAVSSALERVVEAAGECEKWPEQVVAGLAALLHFVVEEPALVRTCMVDAAGTGPLAAERYQAALQPFVSLLKLGRTVSPFGEELPETMEEALVGGIYWIVYQRVTGCSVEGVEQLLPELIEFVLAPYLGADAARELATDKKLAS
ncbi:MAG: TetR/AcrR family transcriptional regulator [Solirubrobacterales bacterium]